LKREENLEEGKHQLCAELNVAIERPVKKGGGKARKKQKGEEKKFELLR